MRKKLIFSSLLVLGTAGVLTSNSESATEAQSLNTEVNLHKITDSDINRLSEAFGHLIGQNLDSPGVTLKVDSIIKGIIDAAQGKEAPMSGDEYELMMSLIEDNLFLELAEKNLNDANAFFKENKKSESITEIHNNKLQYETLKSGTGQTVAEHSAPLIHYKGSYLDGTTFGSSEEAGGPITLPLDHAIPGFREAIIGMQEGEKRRIYIHPDLGYGTTGHLAPNSLLTFEVEIVALDNSTSLTANQTEESFEQLSEITSQVEELEEISNAFDIPPQDVDATPITAPLNLTAEPVDDLLPTELI